MAVQGWSRSGSQILIGTLLLAILSVVVANVGAEDAAAGFDETFANNYDELEVDTVPPEHAWVEDKDTDRSLELTQSTIPNTVSTDDPVIEDQMTQAAAAVAVAKKVLSADKAKAEALINKAEVSGKVTDQKEAAKAVNEARRLESNLFLADKKLKAAKKQMVSLPISNKARAKEGAKKKTVHEEELKKAKENEAAQKSYTAQYGVKTTCQKQCNYDKVCESKKCTPIFQPVCVKYGPKNCFHPSLCAARNKECAEVDHCEARGPTQCDFPRKCLGEETVCKTEPKCVKHRKDCADTFSKTCITCAAKVSACQEARKTAAECGPACASQCGDDDDCQTKCNAGCKTMYEGYLDTCKKVCPACDPTNVCKKNCENSVPTKVCKKVCKQWQITGKKRCHKPCVKMGKTMKCNSDFCAEYTQGPKVCKSNCLEPGKLPAGKTCMCDKYSKMKQEVCKTQCQHTKCEPTCRPTFHTKCIERGPLRCHRPKKCAVPTVRRCTNKRHCARYGAKVCKNKTKCLGYKNVCTEKTECAEHETSCVNDFPPDCVACAAKSESCKAARASSEQCFIKCKAGCAVDKTGSAGKSCLKSCRTGCLNIAAGLVASCKAQCPACKKKDRICQTTCKKTKPVNVCKKKCVQKQELPEKFCFTPCASYGHFKRCDDKFCPKYTYGGQVCDKPCVKYAATATKWCAPKCEPVKCKKHCEYQPKQVCTKYKEDCKEEACGKRGPRCQTVPTCAVSGKKKCNNPTKCVEHGNKCEDKTVCVKKKTKCAPDMGPCTTCQQKAAACGDKKHRSGQCQESCKEHCGADASCKATCLKGCSSISSGFDQACAAACPMCASPEEKCTEVCTHKEVKTECKKVCVKSVLLAQRECTEGKCLATANTKKCEPSACLKYVSAPRTCKRKCVEYKTELHKTCATECSVDPMDSYEEYIKMSNATKAHKATVSACQSQCYNTTYPCPANKLASCTGDFQGQMMSCLKDCEAPASLPTDHYTACMAGCEKYHPLDTIMQCRKKTCAGLDAVEQEQCHKQCYEPRGRCRCACDTGKEYVCKGEKCKCQDTVEIARNAAAAVYHAAAGTASAIGNSENHTIHEGLGAQTVADSAAAAAAKFGVHQGQDADMAARAEREEKAAIKAATQRKVELRKLMLQGATTAAMNVARNLTAEAASTQHEETLLAAKTGAKKNSASLVKKVVKLAALAAAKAAKAKAIAQHKDNDEEHRDVTEAAKAAVDSVVQPIMTMINAVAQQATRAAIEKFPSQDASFSLGDTAKKDIYKTAFTAAKTEAKMMVTKENKKALLADVEKAAAKAAQPRVLHHVKELAGKAASRSRTASLKNNTSNKVATDAAKKAAGRVAQAALGTGKDVIHSAASEAVEHAITGAAAKRLAEHPTKGKTPSKKKLATDVKHALDKTVDTDSSKDAKSQESAAKAAAKQAIMKEVHRASSSASNEAAAKGKTKADQVDAANKAASDVMKKGRQVQQVVEGVTEKKAREKKLAPEVHVHVAPTSTHAAGKSDSAADKKAAKKLDGKDTNKKAVGALVLEAIAPAKKVSHLERRLQEASEEAAESAARKAAKNGKRAAKREARKAAKLAAKSAVLAEVRNAATIAAEKAKNALKGHSEKAQADAASAAASQAAKHVLAIAKKIVNKVAKHQAKRALDHIANDAAKKNEQGEPEEVEAGAAED